MRKYLNLKANIALGLVFAFLLNSIGFIPIAKAQVFFLPEPGQMLSPSPKYNPPILRAIKIHPDNPFKFDFILDRGDENNRHPEQGEGSQGALRSFGFQPQDDRLVKQESTRLIKYFLASLTIPEQDLWVNLSPYERNRIVPEVFGQTEMGRDLLAEDYMLKQITASLIYPEGETGKKFWKRIYAEAAKKFGTTNIPVNTFNKVWIVPEKAVVYENAKAGTAYVVEAKLKVMLEEDYLVFSHSVIARSEATKQSLFTNKEIAALPTVARNDTITLGSHIIRETVIPELTKEVNEGANFTQLRQVYNSLILATWYKKKIRDSILAQVYENQNKIKGVQYEHSVIASHSVSSRGGEADVAISKRTSNIKKIASQKALAMTQQNDVELIYHRYLQAFKKGAYNYIKEEQVPVTQQIIPRKYFSGGMALFKMGDNAQIVEDRDMSPSRRSQIFNTNQSQLTEVSVDLKNADAAMNGLTPDGNSLSAWMKEKLFTLARLTKKEIAEYEPVFVQLYKEIDNEGTAEVIFTSDLYLLRKLIKNKEDLIKCVRILLDLLNHLQLPYWKIFLASGIMTLDSYVKDLEDLKRVGMVFVDMANQIGLHNVYQGKTSISRLYAFVLNNKNIIRDEKELRMRKDDLIKTMIKYVHRFSVDQLQAFLIIRYHRKDRRAVALRSLLNSISIEDQYDILKLLKRVKYSRYFFGIYKVQAFSPHRFSRLESVDALGNSGDPRAKDVLIKALKDQDFRVFEKALMYLREIGSEEDIPKLLSLLRDEPSRILYHVYDDHGAMVYYEGAMVEKNFTTPGVHLEEVKELPNLKRDKILNLINSIRESSIAKRKASILDLKLIKDQKVRAFLAALKANGLEDIVVIGGGVRDALLGRESADIDISVAVPLMLAEYLEMISTTAQANERVYAYAMKRLESLANFLQVPVDDFFDPNKAVKWNGIEIQYSGPIRKQDQEGNFVYIKRALVDRNSLGLFSSSAGASILQMAMDADGQLYGRVEAMDLLEQDKIAIVGDQHNLGLPDILRSIRLKYEFGLHHGRDDRKMIKDKIKQYEKGEITLDAVHLPDVIKAQLLKISNTARSPLDRQLAYQELDQLGIVSLLQEKLNIRVIDYFDSAMLSLESLTKYLREQGNREDDIQKALRLIKDKDHPLVLETGTGNTKGSVELARKGFNVIAIDIYEAYTRDENVLDFENRALEAQRINLPNLIVLRASSIDIYKYLPDDLLHAIVMVHPDYRAAVEFLAQLKQGEISPKLKKDGEIMLKPYYKAGAHDILIEAGFEPLAEGQEDILGVDLNLMTQFPSQSPVYVWQKDQAMHSGHIVYEGEFKFIYFPMQNGQRVIKPDPDGYPVNFVQAAVRTEYNMKVLAEIEHVLKQYWHRTQVPYESFNLWWTQAKRIISMILFNAIDAEYERIDKGNDTKSHNDFKVGIKIILEKNRLVISIHDLGEGIPEDVLRHWEKEKSPKMSTKSGKVLTGGMANAVRVLFEITKMIEGEIEFKTVYQGQGWVFIQGQNGERTLSQSADQEPGTTVQFSVPLKPVKKRKNKDRAMGAGERNLGGIDFTSLNVSQDSKGIKMGIDPEMIRQLQNVAGFVPVIIHIRPLNDLKKFLTVPI